MADLSISSRVQTALKVLQLSADRPGGFSSEVVAAASEILLSYLKADDERDAA